MARSLLFPGGFFLRWQCLFDVSQGLTDKLGQSDYRGHVFEDLAESCNRQTKSVTHCLEARVSSEHLQNTLLVWRDFDRVLLDLHRSPRRFFAGRSGYEFVQMECRDPWSVCHAREKIKIAPRSFLRTRRYRFFIRFHRGCEVSCRLRKRSSSRSGLDGRFLCLRH
jgi:hypothetical protein